MSVMARKTPYKSQKYPSRSADVFVTQRMLFAVRDELKDDIKAAEHRLSYRIDKLVGDNDKLEGTMASGFNKLSAEMANLSSRVYQMHALMEEQNARNIAVIDALTNLFERQERVEDRTSRVEKTMSPFTKKS